MANPQAEHGFVMIALDLFAALMVSDLPNRCMIVLAEHLIESYGPAKKRDVFLDPATIEDHTGLHRNNARRGINELVAANILLRRPAGSYRLNKDYEVWANGGQTFPDRLGGGARKFALWAKEKHGTPIKASKKDTIPRDSRSTVASANDAIQTDVASTSDPIHGDSGEGTYLNPAGFRSSHLPESGGIASTVDASDVTRNGENAYSLAHARASEEFRLERRERTQEGPLALFPKDETHPPSKATRLSPDFGTTAGTVSGSGRDSAEAIALEAWAGHLGTDRNGEPYSAWARQCCDFVPALWVRVLLERRVKTRTDRVGLPYLNKIIGSWMGTGVCEYLKVPAAAAKPQQATPYHTADPDSKYRRKPGDGKGA